MATIDMLCVIDTNGLMKAGKAPGTKESPTSLGSYASSDSYVFMIADGQYVVNSQAKSELTVKANVGDTLRWTITDPSTGLVPKAGAESFSTILYGFKSSNNNNYITTPAVASVPAVNYYNSLTDDTTAAAAAFMSSAWTSSVLVDTNVTVQYSWSFQVIDNATGNVLGYYSWDPFIKISPKS